MNIALRMISKFFRLFGYSVRKEEPVVANHPDVERLRVRGLRAESLSLHFGCGPRVLKGWINIDLAYEPFHNYLQYYTDVHYGEAIRGDRADLYIVNVLRDGLPLPDESVDLIFHEDFFEHLDQKEQMMFLAETFRVLKKGAVHRINTPNLRASMRDHADFSKGLSGVYTDEWEQWGHYSVVSPAILREMADIVGYSSVQFNGRDESIARAQLPSEYRPDPHDRPAADSNVFADLLK